MSSDLLIPTITTGVFGGAALLLPTLAVALLYQHGRYIPLWLPDLGVVGAYVVHALWTRGVPGSVSAVIAFALTITLAWIIQRTLVARFLSSKDYLSPLLIGLGLSQMFQAVASYYGEGMSQHYPDNVWANQFFSTTLMRSVYWVDLAFIVLTILVLGGSYAYLYHTNWGTKVRMVIANPDDARKLALPVRSTDAIVLAVAAILVTTGTLMRGIRFDLQPSMMFYPGLSVIAACIVATPGRPITALAVVVVMQVLASIVGTIPSCSAFQRAIPFAVLLAVLLVREVLLPQITGLIANRASSKIPTVNLRR